MTSVPGYHQVGWKIKGHPLLWLALLSATAVYSIWGAVSFMLTVLPGIRLMDPDARAESHFWLIINTLGQVIVGMVLGYYAFRFGRVCWKMYVPRPSFPPGHCRRCGYDLRGTPEKCPECGTMVPAQPAP